MNIIEFLTSNSVALIAVFTPIILGLVQVFKLFVDNTKYAPIASIVIGVALGVTFSGLPITYGILVGILAGLAASGFYSGAKRITE